MARRDRRSPSSSASRAGEPPRFPSLAVDVAPRDVDEAVAALFELGARGVEERDETTLAKSQGAGKVTLVAAFEEMEKAKAAAKEMPRGWKARVEEVVGDEWLDEWKKHFAPFALCAGVVVKPPWEKYRAKAGEKVLELEPGRAFGTGLHETTALVATALSARARELDGARVLDVGCGSGILSLVALALGAASARAIDVDPDAVEVTLENAARNKVIERLEADTCDARALDEAFPVVVANIEARVLVPMAKTLTERVAPGGLLVLSGVLVTQKGEVREAYRKMTLEEAPERGEWCALILRR